LLDLPESRRRDELIHLGLNAPAHDPGLALPVAGQRTGDQLQLRMPRLAGIDQIPAGRNCGAFQSVYTTALILVLTLLVLSVVHFVHLWRSLAVVLASVARQPRVMAAYSRLPASFGSAKVLTKRVNLRPGRAPESS
jgi:hypothetical protein